MGKFRQTNHNGRFNHKTGIVYNRKHNDRNFDVNKADNIKSDLVSKNIIILFDTNNNPTITDPSSPDNITIDEHEHNM